MEVICSECGSRNDFPQPHAYHAGFGNQGFLYNDAGTSTLVWSSFDPAYEAQVGKCHPWALTPSQRSTVEDALAPSPDGGNWRFENPARCLSCGAAIGQSIASGNIYYYVYPGSLKLDVDGTEGQLRSALRRGA